MNDVQYSKKIQPKTKALAVIFGLIIIGVIIGYVLSLYSLEKILTELNELPIQIPQTRIERSVNYYTAALICLSVEIIVLVGLLYMYLDSYRKTKSRFLIGLNMFIVALFIK